MAKKRNRKPAPKKKITTVKTRALTDKAIAAHRWAKPEELRVNMTEPRGLCCHIGKWTKTFFLRFRGKPIRIGEFDPTGVLGIDTETARTEAGKMRKRLVQGDRTVHSAHNHLRGCQTLSYAWDLYCADPKTVALEEITKKGYEACWNLVKKQFGQLALDRITIGSLKTFCDGVYSGGTGRRYGKANDCRFILRTLYGVAGLHAEHYPGVDFQLPAALPAYARPEDMPTMYEALTLSEAGQLFRALMLPDPRMPAWLWGTLLFQLMGGLRSEDAGGARKDEIDHENNVWAPINEPGRQKIINDHFLWLTKTARRALNAIQSDSNRFFPSLKEGNAAKGAYVSASTVSRWIKIAVKEGWLPPFIDKRHDLRKTVVTGLSAAKMLAELDVHDGIRQRFVGQEDEQANKMDSIYNNYNYYWELRDVSLFWEKTLHGVAGLEPPTYTTDELKGINTHEDIVKRAREAAGFGPVAPTEEAVIVEAPAPAPALPAPARQEGLTPVPAVTPAPPKATLSAPLPQEVFDAAPVDRRDRRPATLTRKAPDEWRRAGMPTKTEGSKLQALSVEELDYLVHVAPMKQLADYLGFSDRAIGKRCERDDIKTPGYGFWNEYLAGHEEAVRKVRKRVTKWTKEHGEHPVHAWLAEHWRPAVNQ